MTASKNDLNSNGQLKWAYWYVTHKKQLRTILTGLLLLFCCLLFAYIIIGLLIYLMGLEKANRSMQTMTYNLVNFTAIRQVHQPHDLQISDVQYFPGRRPSGDKDYIYNDFLAKVANANLKHKAIFVYRFNCGDWQGDWQNGFVLPAEEKYIMDLGVSGVDQGCAARLEINNISWRRFSRREIPDLASYQQERLNLKILELEFFPAVKLKSEEGTIFSNSKVRFRVVNFSPYNYWQLPFNIILLRDGQYLGINRYMIDRFKSGQEVVGEVFWSGQLPPVDDIIIEPDLDIFDRNVYAPIDAFD